jgi:hypothetical protein
MQPTQLVEDPAGDHARARPPAPKELHAGCLQLPHGGSEIVDHEADDRTGGEVCVVLVAWTKHLEGAALGQLEGGKVGPFLAGGQPEDGLKECHHGGVLACPGPAQPMRLTRIPCLLFCSGALRPRSCHIAALEQDQIGRPGTARPMQALADPLLPSQIGQDRYPETPGSPQVEAVVVVSVAVRSGPLRAAVNGPLLQGRGARVLLGPIDGGRARAGWVASLRPP